MATEPSEDTPGLDESLRQAVNDWVVAELGKQRRELHALRRVVQDLTDDASGLTAASIADPKPEQLMVRVNDVSRRLDFLASELAQRLDDQARRLDSVSGSLHQRLDQLNNRIDESYTRLGRLGDVSVRRDEHTQMVVRHDRLERALEALREKLLNTGATFGR